MPLSLAQTNNCQLSTPKTPTCDEVLEACDVAIQVKNKALQLADLNMAMCDNTVGNLSKEVELYKESEKRWYHQPLIMGLLGAAIGIGAYTYLHK